MVRIHPRLKDFVLRFYEKHEVKIDIAGFFAGFIFDIFTMHAIDDVLGIVHQTFYLALAGFILFYELLVQKQWARVPARFEKVWAYAPFAFHFMLGALLSIYSLFFLKSASFFSSLVFVVLLGGLMVVNEFKRFRKSQGSLRIGLYIVCLLSFFSILSPLAVGFVGLVPTLLAVLCTGLVMLLCYKVLQKKCPPDTSADDTKFLQKRLLKPTLVVLAAFLIFYEMGWIPPGPLSVQEMGIYHKVEKSEGRYVVSYENPWWRFWQKGDQEFRAQPGDKIYFFASVFSPARFNDLVILHWYYKDPRAGWGSTDRIAMNVSGGRVGGYRGFSVKQNYAAGDWRVSVETTDGRELGRLYLNVTPVLDTSPRFFSEEIH